MMKFNRRTIRKKLLSNLLNRKKKKQKLIELRRRAEGVGKLFLKNIRISFNRWNKLLILETKTISMLMSQDFLLGNYLCKAVIKLMRRRLWELVDWHRVLRRDLL